MATPCAKVFVALLVACGAAIPARAQVMDVPPLGAQTLYYASRPTQPALPDEVLECMTGPNFPFEDLKGNTALSDDQYRQIYAIETKYRAQIEPLMTQLKGSSRSLQDLMTSGTVAPDKVRALQTQINSQRDQIANLYLEQQLASVEVLSADQRNALGIAKIKGRCSSSHHWW